MVIGKVPVSNKIYSEPGPESEPKEIFSVPQLWFPHYFRIWCEVVEKYFFLHRFPLV